MVDGANNQPVLPSRTASQFLRGTAWVMLLAVCSLFAVGCGYAHRELFPQDVRTVAVPILESRTFYRDVEFELTEALIKEIELRTPYKVVRSDHADTQLAATVVSVNQNVMSRSPFGALPQEMEVSVAIDFEWRDLRTQDVLRDARGFVATGRYIPNRNVGEPFEVARRAAIADLATQIVSQMRADW